MKKIIISHFDNNHSPSWALHEMVDLLIREGVKTQNIHEDALSIYYLTEYLNNFYYYGYADILLKSKGSPSILEAIKSGLERIGANKHLAYIAEQEKIVATLPEADYRQWYEHYPCYGLIQKKLLTTIQGQGFKQISKEEDVSTLASNWLTQLPHFEVATFKEKYGYLSNIANKPLMLVSDASLKAYNFLIACQNKEKLPILMRLCNIELYGEIEKIDHYEWFPEADTETIDKNVGALYSIGVDGAGGHFLLWFYPDMIKEPPVIFLGSEGEATFIAQTFADYILTMPDYCMHELEDANATPLSLREKTYNLKEKLAENYFDQLEADSDKLEEELERSDGAPFWQKNWGLYELLELCSDYEDEFEKEIHLKEMIQLLCDHFIAYMDKAEALFSCTDSRLFREEKKRFDLCIQQLIEKI